MLSLRITDGLASLIEDVASCSNISEHVKSNAEKFRGAESVPWDKLKEIAAEFRRANPGRLLYLHQLCSTTDIVLSAPPLKEKSPELQARLAQLQQALDNKRYSEMVADITEHEQKAEEMRSSILPTSRLQLSFGAHVLVTMFTFWAVAYYGSKFYLSYDELWAGLAGAMGLTVGLMLETILLIIRSNMPVPLEERMPELFDKAKVKEAYARVREMKKSRTHIAHQAEVKGDAPRGNTAEGQQQKQQQPPGAESKKAR